MCDILSGVFKRFGSFFFNCLVCAFTASVIDFFVRAVVTSSSMLTLSAKSENLVNDFTDLSISDDIHGGDYDSHKVCCFLSAVIKCKLMVLMLRVNECVCVFLKIDEIKTGNSTFSPGIFSLLFLS